MRIVIDEMSELTDDALLVLFGNGDTIAAGLLTDRLAPRLLNFVARMLNDRDEAEDVVQEAMLRLWKIAPDWQQGSAKVSTWVFQVARNLATDRLRKRRGVPLEDMAEPVDERPDVEDQLIQSDRMTALDYALSQLPDRQRQAVILRHIEGMSNPEIAVILEISVEAVESLTARGKRALAGLLASRKEELGL